MYRKINWIKLSYELFKSLPKCLWGGKIIHPEEVPGEKTETCWVLRLLIAIGQFKAGEKWQSYKSKNHKDKQPPGQLPAFHRLHPIGAGRGRERSRNLLFK